MARRVFQVWSWSITGYSIAYMAVETVVFFLLTLLLEYLSRRRTIANLIARPGSLPPVSLADKDDDVIKEEQRVNESGCDDVVVLKDMKKIYPGGKVAVRGISLGECYGRSMSMELCVFLAALLTCDLPRSLSCRHPERRMLRPAWNQRGRKGGSVSGCLALHRQGYNLYKNCSSQQHSSIMQL